MRNKIYEYDKLKKLFDLAVEIRNDSELSPSDKYILIFSNECSERVPFDWYDPDTSYLEDIDSFISYFDKYLSRISNSNCNKIGYYYNKLAELE